jgi:crotonobetainyl-CoA:carnitine CoA-transferase CaiB-like acyl-CoA transferase
MGKGNHAGTGEAQTPLAGVRVLDLTQMLAGPYATTLLADLGAEVVKVERPVQGDQLRHVVPYEGREEHQDFFYALNRTKKSIVFDLKEPEHRAVAHRLAEQADAVLENFAPGVAERLGLGWKDLEPLNPRLVYCSISGFGQTGPYRDRPGLDEMIQAIAGLMSVTGDPEGEPRKAGAPLADIISGMMAAYAVLGALYAARRDGIGRYIDLSMQAVLMAAIGPRMAETLAAGIVPQRIGNQNPMRVPTNSYRTADDRFLYLMVPNERFWPPFCRAIGSEEWTKDARFRDMAARVENRAAIDELVAARVRERTAEDWLERFVAAKVPAAIVNDYAEALADPQLRHRGFIHEVEHPESGPIRFVGPPWHMTGPQAEPKAPPLLDQHADEVLADWLGWSADKIAHFKEKTRPGG